MTILADIVKLLALLAFITFVVLVTIDMIPTKWDASDVIRGAIRLPRRALNAYRRWALHPWEKAIVTLAVLALALVNWGVTNATPSGTSAIAVKLSTVLAVIVGIGIGAGRRRAGKGATITAAVLAAGPGVGYTLIPEKSRALHVPDDTGRRQT